MAKKEQQCPAGAPLWMVTFSDLVTLLLTFFVLLLSMANMDPIRFLQANDSIRKAFGWKAETTPTEFTLPIIPSPPKSEFHPIPMDSTVQYFKRIETELKQVKLNDTVEAIQRDNDSIVLRINDSVLFDEGSIVLNPSCYPLLRKIADILRPLPMAMRIEGHTDNTPVRSGPLTNWDISVERAVAVMRFYNRGQIFALDRMSAVGYGETRPFESNATPEGRQNNRRVDFILRSNRSATKGGTIPF
jgi:chemotaxis protein MotB